MIYLTVAYYINLFTADSGLFLHNVKLQNSIFMDISIKSVCLIAINYIFYKNVYFFLWNNICIYMHITNIFLSIFFYKFNFGNRELLVFSLALCIFNIIYLNTDLIIIFILLELLSYVLLYYVYYVFLQKNLQKNNIVIFFNIILNFVATIFFLIVLLFAINNNGSLDVSVCVFMFSNYSLVQLLVSLVFVKIGILPMFFFKYVFYKFLPVSFMYLYTIIYFLYFNILPNFIGLASISNAVVVYIYIVLHVFLFFFFKINSTYDFCLISSLLFVLNCFLLAVLLC